MRCVAEDVSLLISCQAVALGENPLGPNRLEVPLELLNLGQPLFDELGQLMQPPRTKVDFLPGSRQPQGDTARQGEQALVEGLTFPSQYPAGSLLETIPPRVVAVPFEWERGKVESR